MADKYWEDFKVGDEVITSSITITEAHQVIWSGLTMDFYPLHVDEEYAKRSIFKERIASGPMVFALAIGLVVSSGMYGNSILAWLGVENLKMLIPVKFNDTIKVHVKVKEKRETKNPSRGIIKFFWEVKNQGEELVMSVDYMLMFHRKLK